MTSEEKNKNIGELVFFGWKLFCNKLNGLHFIRFRFLKLHLGNLPIAISGIRPHVYDLKRRFVS